MHQGLIKNASRRFHYNEKLISVIKGLAVLELQFSGIRACNFGPSGEAIMHSEEQIARAEGRPTCENILVNRR
jgi:hypothetical protein